MEGHVPQNTLHSTDTFLAQHEFRLVSFDRFGRPQPLPAGLGYLPLFLDDDGFYSVNGPLNLTIPPVSVAAAPINRDNHPKINPSITGAVNSGQRTRSKRSNHLCGERGCTWRSPFPTKQALNRHRDVKHLNLRVDCPIPGCKKVGSKGIKRKDNLPAHVFNRHGIRLPRQPRRQ